MTKSKATMNIPIASCGELVNQNNDVLYPFLIVSLLSLWLSGALDPITQDVYMLRDEFKILP